MASLLRRPLLLTSFVAVLPATVMFAGVQRGTAPASSPNALPLTSYRAALLTARDIPEVLTDTAVAGPVQRQVVAEQNAWRTMTLAVTSLQQSIANTKAIDPKLKGAAPPNPKRAVFGFEWQREIETNPARANAELMDAFLRQDADWSFVKREADWSDEYQAAVDVFFVLARPGRGT